MLSDGAGIAALVMLSVKGRFMVRLVHLASYSNLRGDNRPRLPNTPGVSRERYRSA